ncbi:MAG: AarF/ABC1/UbiB kinase family protein [Chloroflexi bacterium]|nr:AarF/ABC1/UbiB kinase family protein [Chloroflexota bacterium]
MILDKSRRHFHRYKEIARILAKHGWGWMVGRLGLAEHLGKHADLTEKEHAPAHIREMLQELGPTFVKLGQILSTRPDIVPEAYIDELSKLQDTAPTIPFSEIKEVVESEFAAPIRDLYLEIDAEPMAAASLAQVHRAKLLNGTPVIVKVLRPGVRETVETDIEIMYKRAQFLEQHSSRARVYGVLDMVDEFAMTIREEMDYTREARNTDRLRESLSGEREIDVPVVYWNLTSIQVLTLQEMQGIKITDLAANPPPAVNLKQLANRLASAFLEQVFVDGYFHADPHPGNILVTDQGRIALLDCGQAARLDPENRAGAIRMLMAFEEQDSRALADEIMRLGITQGEVEVDTRRLTTDLGKVLRAFYGMPARSVNMGKLLTRVLNVSNSHKVRLPVSFAVLAKVFTNIDGICRQLDGDFNFTEVARSYVGRAVRRELRSENTLNEFYRSLVSARDFLFNLPENLERLMRKAVEGNLRVEFKHQNLEGISDIFRNSSNRIAIALIVGSTIIGSSIIVAAGKGSKSWFGLPTWGILGYAVATIFGAWLIISILRSGRHR